MNAPTAMKTTGTIQWPYRSMTATARRREPSHAPARHHTATSAAKTITVTTNAAAPIVRNTGV